MKKQKPNTTPKNDAQQDFDRIKSKSQKTPDAKHKPHMPTDGFDLIVLP